MHYAGFLGLLYLTKEHIFRRVEKQIYFFHKIQKSQIGKCLSTRICLLKKMVLSWSLLSATVWGRADKQPADTSLCLF